MSATQTTLTNGIDALHILLTSKTITQRDYWLLTNNFRILKDGEKKK